MPFIILLLAALCLVDHRIKAHVFDHIEVDYDRTPLHSSLGYLNPEQFELPHVA